MDPAHVSRLKEEQERSLDETLKQIEKWETFKGDYTVLQDRLHSLPDKVCHNIMVPFGPVAFMPGHIVHTNEVMALLGDNWFVERSAKQACEIIDRRKEKLQEMLSDLAKQRYLLESRLGFTSELKDMSENKGDLVDIREEYDPEKEAKWREERKTKKRETGRSGSKPLEVDCLSPTKASLGETRSDQRKGLSVEDSGIPQHLPRGGESKPVETEPPVDRGGETRRPGWGDIEATRGEEGDGAVEARPRGMTEEELWERLDTLEREEEELDELALQSEDDPKQRNKPSRDHHGNDNEGKHVRWQDKQTNDSDDNENSNVQAEPATITFKHTKQTEAMNTKVSEESLTTPTEISTAMRSPADIYHQYVSLAAPSPEGGTPSDEITRPKNRPPKSILKGVSASDRVKADEGVDGMQRKEMKGHVILPAPPSAFSGRVTERPAMVMQDKTETVAASCTAETTTAPPKRVSRFKAARQQVR